MVSDKVTLVVTDVVDKTQDHVNHIVPLPCKHTGTDKTDTTLTLMEPTLWSERQTRNTEIKPRRLMPSAPHVTPGGSDQGTHQPQLLSVK